MRERILIKNGRVLTPDGARVCDLLVDGGVVASMAEGIDAGGARTFDASGLWVSPGLVDIHCHLREPGYEHKEDIASGTAAAAKGGFTTVCCMANTDPVNDTAAVTSYIIKKAQEAGPIHVRPIAALTMGLRGETLSEAGELAEAGAVALSDDGRSVRDANRMRLGLSYAKRFGLVVITHPEDVDLVDGGVMNEGYWSTALGLPGATRAAEETVIFRDCAIAQIEDARLHVAHVSTRGGADIVRWMKARGARITAETAPHYLYGTDRLAESYDAVAKVNPPLRTEDDVEALKEALIDGTIDCIATDHAPHHVDDKNVEFSLAASGISGSETALAMCWTALVKSGRMTPEQMLEKMTSAPSDVLGLHAGRLEVGSAADIAVIDPDAEWTVDPSKFVSKGKNTPFAGARLTGLVRLTVSGGAIAYEDMEGRIT